MAQEQHTTHPLLAPLALPQPGQDVQRDMGTSATVANITTDPLLKEQFQQLSHAATALDAQALHRKYEAEDSNREQIHQERFETRRKQLAGSETDFVIRPVYDWRLPDEEARRIFQNSVEVIHPSHEISDRLGKQVQQIIEKREKQGVDTETRRKPLDTYRTGKEQQQLQKIRSEIASFATDAKEEWRQEWRARHKKRIEKIQEKKAEDEEGDSFELIPSTAEQHREMRVINDPEIKDFELSREMNDKERTDFGLQDRAKSKEGNSFELIPTTAGQQRKIQVIKDPEIKVFELSREMNEEKRADFGLGSKAEQLAPVKDKMKEVAQKGEDFISRKMDNAVDAVREERDQQVFVPADTTSVANPYLEDIRSAVNEAQRLPGKTHDAVLTPVKHQAKRIAQGAEQFIDKKIDEAIDAARRATPPHAAPDQSSPQLPHAGREQLGHTLTNARMDYFRAIEEDADPDQLNKTEKNYYQAQRDIVRHMLEENRQAMNEALSRIYMSSDTEKETLLSEIENLGKRIDTSPINAHLEVLHQLSKKMPQDTTAEKLKYDAFCEIEDIITSIVHKIENGDIVDRRFEGRRFKDMNAYEDIEFEGSPPTPESEVKEILRYGFYPNSSFPEKIKQKLLRRAKVRFSPPPDIMVENEGGEPPVPPNEQPGALDLASITPVLPSQEQMPSGDLSLPELFLQKRSETLVKDPQALLNPYEEMSNYFRRQDPAYVKTIEHLSKQIVDLPTEHLKAIVSIAVAGHQEEKSIYESLQNYTFQTLPKDNYEIILFVNHPEINKEGNPVKPDNTIGEIKRFQTDYPEMPIRIVQKVMEPAEANIGTILKYAHDIALYRHYQRGKGVGDIALIFNDADNKGIDPRYLETLVDNLEAQPHTDGIRGQLDWDPEDYATFPAVHIGTRLFQTLNEIGRSRQTRKARREQGEEIIPQNINSGRLPSSGASFACRASIYAAVGGTLNDLHKGADVTLGKAIIAARNNDYTRIQKGNSSTRLFTSTRRAVMRYLKEGLAPVEQWDNTQKQQGFSAFDNEVRKFQIGDYKQIDYSNPEQVSQVKAELEYVIDRTLTRYQSNDKTIQGKDTPYFRKALGLLGINYAVSPEGRIQITNMDQVVTNLKEYQEKAIEYRNLRSGKVSLNPTRQVQSQLQAEDMGEGVTEFRRVSENSKNEPEKRNFWQRVVNGARNPFKHYGDPLKFYSEDTTDPNVTPPALSPPEASK